MRLRVVIFDDEPAIRQVLGAPCDRRGYEVFTFPNPGLCPLYAMDLCPCPPGTVCADLLLSDLIMPEVQGMDFVETLMSKLCVAPHLVLMSARWPAAAHARAARLGCRHFIKPFVSAELPAWFDTVEARSRPRGCSWIGADRAGGSSPRPRGIRCSRVPPRRR
jgi:DNA-binding response OmpR family regulator